MLGKLCLATFAACLAFVGGVRADELLKAVASPAIAAPSSVGSSAAEAQPTDNLYMLCAFYPKQGTCEAVYQRALKDNSISAEAVRAEYTGYARYLNGNSPLTEADRQYLKDNAIRMPYDLSAANQAGLHNVINDPSLDAEAKRAAVNNFLSRAVEAELYCGFNTCEVSGGAALAANSITVRQKNE
jgi:hypothetical protein